MLPGIYYLAFLEKVQHRILYEIVAPCGMDHLVLVALGTHCVAFALAFFRLVEGIIR